MSDPFLDSTRNLARWLQEAGQRKTDRPLQASPPIPQPRRRKFSLANEIRGTRWLPLAAVAALAYLQYFYVDAFLQINTLPALVVFRF